MSKQKKRTLELMAAEDYQDVIEAEEDKAYNKGAYYDLLERRGGSDDDDDDDDDDEEEMMAQRKPSKPTSSSANRWFSQSLFKGEENDDDDDDDDEEEDNEDKYALPSALTDKQKRHQKRLKMKAKKEAKELKSLKRKEAPLDIVVGGAAAEPETKKSKKAQTAEDAAKELIRQGMGKAATGEDKAGKIEVVSAPPQYQKVDSDSDDDFDDGMGVGAVYDSDDYDSDERARHLAMGSLLIRKSKRREVINAAYNRYAFNDGPLPSWFVEDENRHFKPQLPVTKAMVDAAKARFKDLASKPIHKVAEARPQANARSKEGGGSQEEGSCYC